MITLSIIPGIADPASMSWFIEKLPPPVTIPTGASFKDMVALKGKSDIGDKINTQVIQPYIVLIYAKNFNEL